MANQERVAREQAQLNRALSHFQGEIDHELRDLFATTEADPELHGFYGQMAYHLGWVDSDLQPVNLPAGKLLRPGLVLWACDLAALASKADAATRQHRHQQALPAAAAVELVHNFSLIHDDIEDRDELRRGRPTVWSIWGEPQAINVGDGMFALARLALWRTLKVGLAPSLAVELAEMLDRTCLRLCEGQHRDMASEASATVTPSMYLDTIARKTAALMRTSTAIGGRIGAPADAAISTALADFGEALGIAFQLRDDLLGIWASSSELGKTAAGDLRRKKMSLPVIQALATATATERKQVLRIYHAPGEASEAQIALLLDILERRAHAWCRAQLADYCQQAYADLQKACSTATESEPALALGALVDYIAIAARD